MRRGNFDDWELRLERLGVVGICDLRLSDGARMVSTGEGDVWLVERRDSQWKLERG